MRARERGRGRKHVDIYAPESDIGLPVMQERGHKRVGAPQQHQDTNDSGGWDEDHPPKVTRIGCQVVNSGSDCSVWCAPRATQRIALLATGEDANRIVRSGEACNTNVSLCVNTVLPRHCLSRLLSVLLTVCPSLSVIWHPFVLAF